MKIKTDDNFIIFPIEFGKINIVIDSERLTRVIHYLNHYFKDKKKLLCAIYDDNDEIINNKDIDFIFMSNKSADINNFQLKEKSVLNTLISNLISSNPEYFRSIENVRNNMYELLTDIGFNKINKILTNGIGKELIIEISNYNIPSLIGMLKINSENYSYSELYLILYNALIFNSRLTPHAIIYLDIPITNEVIKWLKNINKNVTIIINGSCFEGYYYNEANVIKIGKENKIEKYEFNSKSITRFLYINNSFFELNLDLQTKENIELFNYFSDENITYFVKFATDTTKNIL